MYVYMFANVNACMCRPMYAHMFVSNCMHYIHVCTHIYMYICMHVCEGMYACLYVWIYTYRPSC